MHIKEIQTDGVKDVTPVAQRDNPYGAFNFMVKLGNGGSEDQIVGGFSDVSGLGNEVKYSEYRNGNDKENHVRKVANVNSCDDITLKRGVIGDVAAVHLAQGHSRGELRPADGDGNPARRKAHAGVLVDPSAGPAEEVGRPHAHRQGRR